MSTSNTAKMLYPGMQATYGKIYNSGSNNVNIFKEQEILSDTEWPDFQTAAEKGIAFLPMFDAGAQAKIDTVYRMYDGKGEYKYRLQIYKPEPPVVIQASSTTTSWTDVRGIYGSCGS